MDRWFAASIPFTGEPEMARVVVPLTELREIVAAMPADQDVSMSEKAKRLTISSGRSRYVLPLSDIAEWPECTGEKDMATFSFQSSALRTALETTSPTISDEEARYYMNGIHFLPCDGYLRLASTDGHRLTYLRLPIAEHDGTFKCSIVPTQTISIYSKLLRDLSEDQPVRLGLKETGTFLEGKSGNADIALFSKVIDGTFPDTDRVIPKTSFRAALPAEEIEGALNRIAVVAGKTKSIAMQLDEDGMTISTTNAGDSSEGVEQIDGITVSSPIRLGFNLDYVRTMLRQLGAGSIDVHYNNDPTSPAIFLAAGQELETAERLVVIMPRRV